MKIPRPPHNWSVSVRQAVAIQKRLAMSVSKAGLVGPVRFVAGVDAAFSREGLNCLAGVVLWDLQKQAMVEDHVASRRLLFPYIPGLLSFREAPAALAALRKLQSRPDVLLCDGQGIAHPRRLGIASHLGVLVDLPTVGCAKSRLVGTYEEPGLRRGSRSRLKDGDEVIGAVLRTRDKVKPLFISVGHGIDLQTAERLVLACSLGYRLPEPVRLADRLVAAAKKKAAKP